MAQNRPSRKGPKVSELLNRFAAEETDFLKREFLSPALRDGIVRVRIGGVVCKVRISPNDFEGWGVFQPTSHSAALLVRQASLAERRKYLELFPMIRLIVCRRTGNTWFGSAASYGDARIHIEGMAPLQLVEEVQLFDCVRSRYDGMQFWFDELDMRHDPGTAAYLRSALNDQTPPGDLERSGMTAEERAAYELNYWELMELESEPEDSEHEPRQNALHRRRSRRPRAGEGPIENDPARQRLRETLSHAGAQLIGYLERGDSFRVQYTVDGRHYTTSVDKQDLTVQVAGICLSGEDEKFDLGSLVGVLREGSDGRQIVPVGEHGMDEDDYWRVHPRRNR